jgi:hypothetical protein
LELPKHQVARDEWLGPLTLSLGKELVKLFRNQF